MARINNKTIYPVDGNVTLEDSLIGNDFDDNNKTKNFEVKGLLNAINTGNGFSSIRYKFSSDVNIHSTTKGQLTTNGANVDPANITLLRFGIQDLNTVNLSSLLTAFDVDKANVVITLSDSTDPNSLISFKITSITTTSIDFIDLGVTKFLSLSTENFVDAVIYTFNYHLSI